MAVTATVAQFAAALRVGDATEETAQIERVRNFAIAALTRHLGAAYGSVPEAVANEAAFYLAGYSYDRPTTYRGAGFADSLRNSGAAALVLPWRIHRAGTVAEAISAAQDAVGTAENPVINVAVAGAELIVSFADGTSRTEALPESSMTGGTVDQTARTAAADAQSTADSKLDPGAVNPFALATPHVPIAPQDLADEDAPPSAAGLIPQTVTNGRSYRHVEPSTLFPGSPPASETQAGIVRGATETQAEAVSGTTILGWTQNRLRAFLRVALPTVSVGEAAAGSSGSRRAFTPSLVHYAITTLVRGWARDDTTPIPAPKLVLAPTGQGENAATWAEEGNEDQIPTPKVNYEGVQNQLDVIHEELSHTRGPQTVVVGVLGGGSDSLRYTLPADLDGEYDVSVQVKARVQVNALVTITGSLRIVEDGGLGLDLAIPSKTHGYGHAHEATLSFIRRGLPISPGVNQLNFTTLVTGNNPPDAHFVEVENLTLTDTSLVNANNVHPFVLPFAQSGNTDPVPDEKLETIRPWALASADEDTTPQARDLGRFTPADIAAIPNGGSQEFYYRGFVERDTDGTLAYHGGSWRLDSPGGGGARWYEMARLFTSELAENTAAEMELRTDGLVRFADISAIRAAIASKEISMFVLQRSDSDAQVPGINAPNFLASMAANYAVEFRFPNSEFAIIRFHTDAIRVTPGFAISSALRFDLGVFA